MTDVILLFTLDGSEGKYTVQLTHEGALVARATFEYDDTSTLGLQINKIEKNTCTLDDLSYVGLELWDRLRAGAVGEYLEKAWPEWERGQRTCQLRLHIGARALQVLPWECLYDQRHGFLGHQRGRPSSTIVRGPGPGAASGDADPRPTGPLRVLVVIPQGSFLQVEQEWHNLRTCFEELPERVHVQQLTGRVTVNHLDDALRAAPWDVIHYVGHGKLDAGAQARVRFNADGDFDGEHWIEGEPFAELVAARPPALVFLNCCLSGTTSARGSLSGLGPYLLRAGVPAVVAMRYEVPDAQAIRFSREFYRELLKGEQPGRLDRAVSFARRSLFLNKTDSTVRGFVTPVVYLAPDRAQLFAWDGPSSEADHAPLALPVPARAVPAAPKPAWVAELRAILQKRRCIPVIGPGLCAGSAMRLATAAPGVRLLAKKLAEQCQYADLEGELRLCEQAGEWLDFVLFQWVCQHYHRMVKKQTYKLWDELTPLLQPCLDHSLPALKRFLARWPDTPGIICSHFDGLVPETLRSLRQQLKVIDALDHKPLDVVEADRILLNLRGSLARQQSLVLTKAQHDELWDRISKIDAVVQDHLITGTPGRGFLFLGVHPRDDLVRHLVDKLVQDREGWCGPSYFVARRWTPAEEGYWEPFQVTWIEADDPSTVMELLGE